MVTLCVKQGNVRGKALRCAVEHCHGVVWFGNAVLNMHSKSLVRLGCVEAMAGW